MDISFELECHVSERVREVFRRGCDKRRIFRRGVVGGEGGEEFRGAVDGGEHGVGGVGAGRRV